MDQFRAKVLLEQKRNQLHLESFMRHDNIQKSKPEDINPFDQFEEDIQKGKKASIGETRIWNGKKMRKQANGKWVEVSEHGMTKKEHESKSEYYHGKGANKVSENISNRGSKGAKLDFNASKFHNESASKLSDKEYSDEEVGGEEDTVKVYLGNDKNSMDLMPGEAKFLLENTTFEKDSSGKFIGKIKGGKYLNSSGDGASKDGYHDAGEFTEEKVKLLKDSWAKLIGGKKEDSFFEQVVEDYVDEDTGEVVKIKKNVLTKQGKSELNKRLDSDSTINADIIKLKELNSLTASKFEKKMDKFFDLFNSKGELTQLKYKIKELNFEMEQAVAEAEEGNKDKVGNEYGSKLEELENEIDELKGDINKGEEVYNKLNSEYEDLSDKRDSLHDKIKKRQKDIKDSFYKEFENK